VVGRVVLARSPKIAREAVSIDFALKVFVALKSARAEQQKVVIREPPHRRPNKRRAKPGSEHANNMVAGGLALVK